MILMCSGSQVTILVHHEHRQTIRADTKDRKTNFVSAQNFRVEDVAVLTLKQFYIFDYTQDKTMNGTN
jgi:hypothetical protein